MDFLHFLTVIHTWISLLAIFAGFVVVFGFLKSLGRQLMTFGFWVTAWLSTLTGFIFPFNGPTPAFVLGLISLLPLTFGTVARYQGGLKGAWRGTYVINAVVVLYLNVFVLIVQAFLKIPALNALAPTQKEPPFQIAQLVALAAFVVLGVLSFRAFKPKFLDPIAKGFESPNVG